MNKEKVKAYQKAYQEDNKEKLRALNKAYDKANKEKIKAQKKEDNREKVNALVAKRRAAKLQRTPDWLTEEHLSDIELAYSHAQQLRELTGVDYHVDHIVPLQGDTVSGLHVPWNLQVITAAENLSKSNTWEGQWVFT